MVLLVKYKRCVWFHPIGNWNIIYQINGNTPGALLAMSLLWPLHVNVTWRLRRLLNRLSKWGWPPFSYFSFGKFDYCVCDRSLIKFSSKYIFRVLFWLFSIHFLFLKLNFPAWVNFEIKFPGPWFRYSHYSSFLIQNL